MFSIPYSKEFKEIANIINKFSPILLSDPALSKILTSGHRCVAKKAFTLGKHLSPSVVMSENAPQGTWLQHKGNHKCGHGRCICCGFMNVIKTFTSMVTGQTFQMDRYINCNTTHVVYLITCHTCKLPYIGSTKCELKTRIRRHMSDVNSTSFRQVSAVSKRNCIDNHDHSTTSLTVQGIERVVLPPRGGDLVRKLRSRETYWMFVLQTYEPMGLNRRLDLDLHF